MFPNISKNLRALTSTGDVGVVESTASLEVDGPFLGSLEVVHWIAKLACESSWCFPTLEAYIFWPCRRMPSFQIYALESSFGPKFWIQRCTFSVGVSLADGGKSA